MTNHHDEMPDDEDEVITFEPGVREGIGLLIGLWGDGGSGKTLTASLMARGLAAEPGEDLQDPASLARIDARVAYIDTDGRRAQHYAPVPGALPSADPHKPAFGFRYADFAEPFSPMRLARYYMRAEASGFKVIVTDSFSLIWEGRGGVIDMHDTDAAKALARKMQRYEEDKRNNPNAKPPNEESVLGDVAHWKRAKVEHRRMVTRIIQCRAHMIFAGHADDKMRMEEKEHSFTKGRGENQKTITYTKNEVTPPAKLDPKDRWVPICEKKFPRQLALSLILTPDAPGIAIPKKTLNEHFKPLIPLDRPLDTRVGVALATWARGAEQPGQQPLSLSPAANNPSEQRTLGGASPGAPPLSSDDERDRYSDYQPSEPPPPHPETRVYVGVHYRPDTPRAIAPRIPIMTAEPPELKAWAATLRDMIEHAPDDNARRAWKSENAADLLRLTNRSQNLHGWALEHMPSEPPAQDEIKTTATGEF